MKNFLCAFLMLAVLLIFGIKAQTIPDPALLAEINRIKAIDNHAHPLPFLDEREKDMEFDVPESIPPLAPPVRLRPSNPEYLEARRALYDYKYNDFSEAHLRELIATKRRVMNEKGWLTDSSWAD
jgi:hypothetical protein